MFFGARWERHNALYNFSMGEMYVEMHSMELGLDDPNDGRLAGQDGW